MSSGKDMKLTRNRLSFMTLYTMRLKSTTKVGVMWSRMQGKFVKHSEKTHLNAKASRWTHQKGTHMDL